MEGADGTRWLSPLLKSLKCVRLRGLKPHRQSAAPQAGDRWMAPNISSSGLRRADLSVAAHTTETEAEG